MEGALQFGLAERKSSYDAKTRKGDIVWSRFLLLSRYRIQSDDEDGGSQLLWRNRLHDGPMHARADIRDTPTITKLSLLVFVCFMFADCFSRQSWI